VGLTGLTGVTTQSGDFEAEDTRQDRKACVKAKQVCGRWASVRWSDDKDFRKFRLDLGFVAQPRNRP
jgi:uncharacterized protein YcnI